MKSLSHVNCCLYSLFYSEMFSLLKQYINETYYGEMRALSFYIDLF